MHFLTHSTLSRSACQTANSTRYLQLFQALQIAKIASAQAAQAIACQNSVEKGREREGDSDENSRKIEARKSIYYCLPQFSRNVILMCHADLRAGLISQGKMPEYAAIVPCHLDTWVAATHLNPSPSPSPTPLCTALALLGRVNRPWGRQKLLKPNAATAAPTVGLRQGFRNPPSPCQLRLCLPQCVTELFMCFAAAAGVDFQFCLQSLSK